MAAISRREFFKKTTVDATVAAIMASGVARLRANPLGLPIGSQTYPHRMRIRCGDFAGLLKDMKGIGIEVLELCDPINYADFKPLADGKAAKKILDDNGMKAISAHVGMRVYRENYADVIKWAHDIGLTQLSTADLGGKMNNGWTTDDDIKRAADEYSKIAENTKKEGFQQALHNEGFANSRTVDGRLTYPILIEHLSPLVGMQFQMSSMTTVGDPIAYFNLYPGRFVSAHLQGVDATQGMRAGRAGALPAKSADATGGRRGGGAPAGGDPCAAPTAQPAATAPVGGRGGAGGGGLALGEDTVDWPKVFAAGKVGGMKNAFIEQAWELTVKSAAYLKTLT